MKRDKMIDIMSKGIPKDWQIVKLVDIATYINGYPFSPKDWKEKGLPIIRIQNLNDPEAEFNYFDGEIDKKYFVENGDLLFSWSASIGVYIWNRGKAVLNQHIFKVVPKENVNKLYLYYALYLAIEQLKNRVHGSTMKHFKRSELKTTLIPLPPLPEQKKIAEILSTVDKAIEKVDEAIAKTERLKKGLMQELLTKGIGHKEFKYSKELGCEIPKEWKVVKLSDVAKKFISGGTPSTKQPKYWNGDIPWIRSVHITKYYLDESMIEQYITKEGLENSASNIVPKDSLIVATRVGIGKSTVNLIDVAINQDLTGIVLNESKVDPFYLVLYFHFPKIINLLEAVARGTTIKGISQDYIKNMLIPLPPIEEQRKIAEILSTVDKKLELERKRKEKLERIKKGLMNDLLTGRKRVKV